MKTADADPVFRSYMGKTEGHAVLVLFYTLYSTTAMMTIILI